MIREIDWSLLRLPGTPVGPKYTEPKFKGMKLTRRERRELSAKLRSKNELEAKETEDVRSSK